MVQTTLTVALIGNPNTGKSTLFGSLVGIQQHVGNYPGVTVEKKTGLLEYENHRFELVDLPGLYSLAPRSRDEMVAVDLLLGRGEDSESADAVLCIVDAGNLERNLYLVSQVLEIGLPTVIAVNMIDVAERHGVSVDLATLEQRLGIPVVATQANRGLGRDELIRALARVVHETIEPGVSPMPEAFEEETTRLKSMLTKTGRFTHEGVRPTRFLTRRLLLDVSGYLQGVILHDRDESFRTELESARTRLAAKDCPVPTCETTARYDWARQTLDRLVTRTGDHRISVSDRIDYVLTHRFFGTLIFALVMLVVFQSVFVWAEPLMNRIDQGVNLLANVIRSRMLEGALRSLLADGVLGGVGGVLVFLPQILILFAFIAILEDCGYMARAAYLMDKFMVRVGLSGKSFIPMLSSFACAIPGIMATRVIENERDRLTTILVAPLMTCSARLPIYALLIAAFIPDHKYLGGLLNLQGLTLAGLYVLGIVTAVLVARLLKRSVLKGDTPPFVMELPSYKMPSLQTILTRVFQRGFLFVKCAGTMILAVSILVWAALYFPHDSARVEGPFAAEIEQLESRRANLPQDTMSERTEIDERLIQIEHEILGNYQRQSYLGRMGRFIEPVFRPLGWDWRISSAVIASFPAREIVVATLGVIYHLGEDVDTKGEEDFSRMKTKLHSVTWDGTDRPVFTIPVALSVMVFFALCAQCAATLAVIRRETQSWRWPAFTFVYMTVLAYTGALITYQVGTWIGG